ncbi:DUF397 domain-containing protein [Streptomyces sp. G45]|uniref:DUF397 domain-containing protein n=1 Tax=Streptomyces sp. G45 TaxID=3406627 RepID=UPI003C16458D
MADVFTYRKSRYSDPKAACVEVATNIPHTIAVRDSKNPTGPTVTVAPTPWTVFLTTLINKSDL